MMQYLSQPVIPQLSLFHTSFSALFTLVAIVAGLAFISWFIHEEAKQ